MWALAAAMVILAIAKSCQAAYIKDYPVTLSQPDGTRVRVLVTGDEFYNWAHDAAGYVIVRHPANGRLVYATEINGEVAPTNFVVNRADPRRLGLRPNIAAKHAASARALSPLSHRMPKRSNSPKAHNTGSLNNIVIYIRFADEQPTAFTHALSQYDAMLNGAAGTNSLRNYYKEVSYNTLTISSVFFPTQSGSTIVSYQDTYPRAYYKPYDATTNPTGYQSSQQGTRELNLLRAALAAVKPAVDASGITTDSDHDGYVDNVVFVVDGDVTAWATLLWPHMWWLGNGPTLGGATVGTFNFQLENFTFSGSGGVGVLCHEMFHSLGAPDLYHYSYDGLNPAGAWDIMEYNQNPPQHMTSFMKWKYGTWIATVPEITASGHYTLNPTTSSTNNCYKIKSLASTTQYFMVEYRRKTGTFEGSVPGTGLIVYRIDTTTGNGNANGPPDELYIYRPNGTPTVNGNTSTANLSYETGRTSINSASNPTPFLQNGSPGLLDIHNVTSAGTTISFDITVGYPAATKVGFLTQPGPSRPGTLLSPQPVVAALSDSGVVNPTFTGPVTLSIKSGAGAAGATLGGTTTVNLVNGRATFTDLTVDLEGTGYVLTASCPGLVSADSAPFYVGVLPEKLRIITQPAGGDVSKPLSVQPVVQVTDASLQLAQYFTGPVTVAIKPGTGTSGAVLSGATVLNAMAGVAAFSGLKIDKPGTGYVLTVTSGALPAVDSQPFTVLAHTASTVYVNKDATGATHDGTTWATAWQTVQAGINSAVSGDEVWVAASTTPYIEKIALKAGVAVYGGFAGAETARSARNWKTNVTVLDGSGTGNASAVTSSVVGAVLDGFTVCNAAGGYPGVYVTAGTAAITNCAIVGNSSRGLSVAVGAATATNCVISGNTYGVYVASGSATVANCTISGNSSSGLYVYNSAVATITNCIAAFNGTGIGRYSTAVSVTLSHNDVFGNTSANYNAFTDPTGVNGNINLDPTFANRTASDFHVTTGSPCIDAGDDGVVTTAETDLDGQPRIIGAHVDIGAYEYSVTAAPFTLPEAATALQIFGGLTAAASADLTRLNVEGADSSLDIADAVRIARKAMGLEPNP
jgi:M6 family metalloprotease-like protein